MQSWMMTGPRTIHRKIITELFKQCDVKKWIIAKETGEDGYEHWQIRCTASRPDFFDYCHDREPRLHIEKAATEEMEYERKSGHFWTSMDTPEIRQCRFGKPNNDQRKIMRILDRQGIRNIDVFYDPIGGRGKSWLSIHLFETGLGCIVPRYACTAEKLSAFICSSYKQEPYIIIDIPRASKPTQSLYETLEELKDGLVFDPRYSGHTRDIRGVKVCVFTNHKLDLKQLSDDRWNLHGWSKDGTLS